MDLYQFSKNRPEKILGEKRLVWRELPQWKRDIVEAKDQLRKKFGKEGPDFRECDEEIRQKAKALNEEYASVREGTAQDFIKKTKELSKEIDLLAKKGCQVEAAAQEHTLDADAEPEGEVEEAPVEHSDPEMVKADKKLRRIGAKYGAEVYFSEQCDTDENAVKIRRKKYRVIEGALKLLEQHHPELLEEADFEVTIRFDSYESSMAGQISTLKNGQRFKIIWYTNDSVSDDPFKTPQALYQAIWQAKWDNKFLQSIRHLKKFKDSSPRPYFYYYSQFRKEESSGYDYEEIYKQGEWRIRELIPKLRRDQPELLERMELANIKVFLSFDQQEELPESAITSIRLNVRDNHGWKSVQQLYTDFVKGADDFFEGRAKTKLGFSEYNPATKQITISTLGKKQIVLPEGMTVGAINEDEDRLTLKEGKQDLILTVDANRDTKLTDARTGEVDERFYIPNLDQSDSIRLIERKWETTEVIVESESGHLVMVVTKDTAKDRPNEEKITTYYVVTPKGFKWTDEAAQMVRIMFLDGSESVNYDSKMSAVVDKERKLVIINGADKATLEEQVLSDWGAFTSKLHEKYGLFTRGEAIFITTLRSSAAIEAALEANKIGLSNVMKELGLTSLNLHLVAGEAKSFREIVMQERIPRLELGLWGDLKGQMKQNLIDYWSYLKNVKGKEPKLEMKALEDRDHTFSVEVKKMYDDKWSFSDKYSIDFSDDVFDNFSVTPEKNQGQYRIRVDDKELIVELTASGWQVLGDNPLGADYLVEIKGGALTIKATPEYIAKKTIRKMESQYGMSLALVEGKNYDYEKFTGENGYLAKLRAALEATKNDPIVQKHKGMSIIWLATRKITFVSFDPDLKQFFYIADLNRSPAEIQSRIEDASYTYALRAKFHEMDKRLNQGGEPWIYLDFWRGGQFHLKDMYQHMGEVEAEIKKMKPEAIAKIREKKLLIKLVLNPKGKKLEIGVRELNDETRKSGERYIGISYQPDGLVNIVPSIESVLAQE